MAWRFHGRARVSARNPEAFGVCDRCGIWYNLNDLRFQYDWRGNRLMNLNFRVCHRCYDKPFEHYRPIIVPPDPVPQRNPRPDLYAPFMATLVSDTLGGDVQDTLGGFVQSVPPAIPPLSNAGPTPTGIVTTQYADDYEITAPDGGPVILIPE
ncbi:MAG TPA: hypothetical protein PLV07_07410 [Acidiphilium sp.]|uniref:hypothetical protein n=1 Tax=unclassified Acidiphilium TaxID=2617493 RepID=UPI000BD8EAA8|nr:MULTISPECIES: hypothetical protein [unclassified Acidiphilium]OYV54507.1 MAG: hypothetical protein B7Z76_14115 [Acidiphilium sp. 20-67-58]HQT62722.1 hypothetical protein [Acidiphilium sp.]HQU11396.1 hypothetical protein [Acidiphilium sp.]